MSARITDLNIAIGSSTIVHDINMEIRDGQRVGLIGSSGSGKSMISRAMMGLLPVQARATGSIMLHDQEILHMPDDQLAHLRGASMSMIFQNPGSVLNPLLTVGKQIALPLTLHYDVPADEQRERVMSAMHNVGLDESLIDRRPYELSGGQQQRVGIATALITSPRLIIADEPTTALDSITQRQIVDLLVSLVDQAGAALLFITHDFSVLARATHYCYVLDHGHIVEQGRTSRILEHPSTEQGTRLVESARQLTLHRDSDRGEA